MRRPTATTTVSSCGCSGNYDAHDKSSRVTEDTDCRPTMSADSSRCTRAASCASTIDAQTKQLRSTAGAATSTRRAASAVRSKLSSSARSCSTPTESCGVLLWPGEYAECEAARPSTTTTTEAMDCCFARAAKWLCNEGVIEDDAQDECVIEEVQSLKLFDDVSFFHFRSCFGALSSKSCDGIERVEGAVFVDIDAGERCVFVRWRA